MNRRWGALGALLLVLFLLPFRAAEGESPWPLALLLAGAIGTVGVVGAVILWRSPPLNED